MSSDRKRLSERKKLSKSILQDRTRRYCYLCSLLNGDPWGKEVLQEHHIFSGPLRKKSEHYGLKVYLCFEHHGAKGDMDVHRPDRNDFGLLLKAIGQKAFEIKYSHEYFMKEFGKDYIAGYLYDDGQCGNSDQLQHGEEQNEADRNTG